MEISILTLQFEIIAHSKTSLRRTIVLQAILASMKK